MPAFSVETTRLQSGRERINRLGGRVAGLREDCSRIRSALDWDVKGEQQLDQKLSRLIGQIGEVSDSLQKAGGLLGQIEGAYAAGQGEAKRLVDELPVDMGSVTSEESVNNSQNTPKTLEDLYSINPESMKDQAIQLSVKGNTVTIKAYINFTGDANKLFGNTGKSFAEIVTEGIKERWTTTIEGSDYDFINGLKGNTVVEIVSMIPGKQYFNTPEQKYLHIDIDDSDPLPVIGGIGKLIGEPDWSHISHRDGSGDEWSKSNNGDITLYDNYYGSPYTENKIKSVAAHEFGHALGIGDIYAEANGGKELISNDEITDGRWGISSDIMWGNGKVSSNDVEMVLEAFKTDEWQYFIDYGGNKKSSVVRLPQEFAK
ncbi:MAG TPA: hypothetical protein VHT96_18560 [Clostridia bacterium]|nr:hypothetical protein [Clostridia bacterium]